MSRIRFAEPGDIDRLMRFMHEHWRAGHILSRNRELFLHDFLDDGRLNIAIAENADRDLIGLFGFMKYNSRDLPDIAGSLWKVVEGQGEPMLGLRLRRFVIEKVPHRYFAAPGAGLQTRAIYRLIDMDWIEMEQYFRINPESPTHELYVDTESARSSAIGGDLSGYQVSETDELSELARFRFDAHDNLGPAKDLGYLEHRFFAHPINVYRTFLVRRGADAVAIGVCRVVHHAGASALRIVDYYGEDCHVPALIAHLDRLMRHEGHEYLDFVCSGFSPRHLAAAGLRRLDFDSEATIVPNFFEPFMRSNVRVYAVADRDPAIRPRLCKADGDQDRPNFDRGERAAEQAAEPQAVGA